jgi:hypothetical protein
MIPLSFALLLGACSDDSGGTPDSAPALEAGAEAGSDGPLADSGADVGRPDSAAPDASTPDGSAPDVSAPDASAPDATIPDAARPDTAVADAGPPDVGTTDGGLPVFTAPLSWDFESSCMGLSKTRDWECGKLNFSAGSGCSSSAKAPTGSASGPGKGMWGTVLNDCYNNLGNNSGSSATSCNNTNPSDDSILSFAVKIPAGWSGATLTYYSWDDVNGYFDWMEVRVNNTSALRFCDPSPPPSGWTRNTVDLSAYTGKTVSVAFHFLASTVVAYSGWYIDDLSVTQGAPTDGGVTSD